MTGSAGEAGTMARNNQQELPLIPPGVAAVVFDCDGLLLDTEPLWEVAEREFLESLGGRWHSDIRQLTFGRSVRESAASLAALAHSCLSPAAACEELVERFGEVSVRRPVPLMPGTSALLTALGGAVPLAVASNTPSPLVERMLTRAGIRDCFERIIGAGGSLRPKPAGDVYLAACRALNTSPSRVLALEDSQTGVDSAIAAGLAVIGVNSDPKTQPGGCPIVADLTALVTGRQEVPGE